MTGMECLGLGFGEHLLISFTSKTSWVQQIFFGRCMSETSVDQDWPSKSRYQVFVQVSMMILLPRAV